LLHTCCAPCAIYPLSEAKKDSYSVEALFCNSNIHPQSEYVKRKNAVKAFFRSAGVELIFLTYNPGDFFDAVAGNESPPERCAKCWRMRLAETASFAKQNGFDAFTTTLLGSPYQDHAAIKEISEGLSRERGVKFYYKDFRLGFKAAQERARQMRMYRQKYCGCAFSLKEKNESHR
jgi:predicted adenine nucleotide alpha hydrolase (AANH) superfamily ATPase